MPSAVWASAKSKFMEEGFAKPLFWPSSTLSQKCVAGIHNATQ